MKRVPMPPKPDGPSVIPLDPGSRRPKRLFGKNRVFVLTLAFLTLLLVGFGAMGVWFWFGSLEESVPGMGQIVPTGRLRRVMSPMNGMVTKVHVKENQAVKAGQVLVELDPQPAEIETEGLQEQIMLLQQEAQALQSASMGGMPDSSTTQGAWVMASRQAYEAQMIEAQNQIEESRYRYQEAQARVKQTKDVLNAGEQLLKNYENLYKDGGISAKELEEYRQKVLDQRGELAALQETVQATKEQLKRTRERPREIRETYQRDILAKLSEHQQNIARLKTDMEKGQYNLKHQVIFAPIDGTVNEQVIRGPGEVVTGGQTLLSLVPADSEVIAEVRVTNRDMSYIHLKQRAALRLDAFPYQQFGRLYGTVVGISPSTHQVGEQDKPTQTEKNQGGDVTSSGAFYVLLIKPDKTVMTLNGQKHPVRSGMTLSADIITREKNILSFFTEPINIHFDRAFRDPSNR